jgi:hypothetical protein
MANEIDDLSKIELLDIETPYELGATTFGAPTIPITFKGLEIAGSTFGHVHGIPIFNLAIPGTDSAGHNVSAMDEMSSLILIGPPPKQVPAIRIPTKVVSPTPPSPWLVPYSSSIISAAKAILANSPFRWVKRCAPSFQTSSSMPPLQA